VRDSEQLSHEIAEDLELAGVFHYLQSRQGKFLFLGENGVPRTIAKWMGKFKVFKFAHSTQFLFYCMIL
jgi:hypothetical protein